MVAKRDGSEAIDLTSLENREVRGVFLAQQLEGAVRVIRITGAEIVGDLDVSNREIRAEVSLIACRFRGSLRSRGVVVRRDLTLDRSTFLRHVQLDGAEVFGSLSASACRFEDPSAAVRFERIRVHHRADFSGATFAAGAVFDRSRFENDLSLSRARFQNGRSSPSARVISELGWVLALPAVPAVASGYMSRPNASLDRITVASDLDLTDASFDGELDLTYSQIGHNVRATGTAFNDTVSDASLNGATIGGSLFLSNSRFAGAIDFSGARIKHNVISFQTLFEHPWKSVAGEGVQIGGRLIISKAVFQGGLNLLQAEIGSSLEADGTEFKSHKLNKQNESLVVLNSCKVKGGAFLNGAKFSGGINLNHAEIEYNLDAKNVEFLDDVAPVALHSLHVGRHALFKKALFAGPVDFTQAMIGGELEASDAQFQNHSDFYATRAGGSVTMANAHFHSLTYFEMVDFARDLNAIGAKFLLEKHPSAGVGLFKNNPDPEVVSFAGAKIGFVNMTNAHFHGRARFGYMLVQMGLSLESAKFLKSSGVCASFGNMNCKGNFELRDTHFLGTVLLNDCVLQTADFSRVSWAAREGAGKVHLNGTTYQNLLYGDPDDFEEFLDILGRFDETEYTASSYQQLEGFFRQNGESEKANRVLYSRKSRERDRYMLEIERGNLESPWYVIKWVFSHFHYALVRYGAHPERALLWTALVIAIGVVVFKPERMQRREEDKTPKATGPDDDASSGNDDAALEQIRHPARAAVLRAVAAFRSTWFGMRVDSVVRWMSSDKRGYNRIIYSFDLFIPAVSLYMEKAWKPNETSRIARVWWVIHKVAGWVVVPIGLIALSGIAKL